MHSKSPACCAGWAFSGNCRCYFGFGIKPTPSRRRDRCRLIYVNKRTGDGIVLKTRNGIVRLPATSIHFAEVVRHNVIFHTDNGIFESRSSLNRVESQLKPFGFSRCNACYLVNLRYVSKVEDNTLYLAGEKLEISRGKKAQFIQDLMHFLEV